MRLITMIAALLCMTLIVPAPAGGAEDGTSLARSRITTKKGTRQVRHARPPADSPQAAKPVLPPVPPAPVAVPTPPVPVVTPAPPQPVAVPAPPPSAPVPPPTTASIPPPVDPNAIVAGDARLAGDDRRTRLIVDLAGPTTGLKFQAFTLANPYRVVLDLPQIDFTLPAEIGKKGRGLVQAWRFGLIAAGKSRVVLDLAGPATVDKAFVLDALDDQPARLVLDLVKSDPAAFMQALAAAKQAAVKNAEPTAPATPPPPEAPAAPQGAPPLVVIDPGHGGIDTGALTRDGQQEKDIVLGFARRLAAKLEASGHYRAMLTRSDDSFVSLAGRVDFARANHAALFISIHADTLPDPFGVRGATIYTLSDTASDEESARYAEQENRSDLISGVDLSSESNDVADILIDLTRRETKAFSNRFARVLIDQFRSAATLNKNPHRSAGFRVLKASDIPSVLLELGYLSNSKDLELLTSVEWQEKTTIAVTTAVDSFFAAKAGEKAEVN